MTLRSNSPDDLLGQARHKREEAQRLEDSARKHREEARVLERQARDAQLAENAKIPVDRTQQTLADGRPVTEDHRETKPNGQQKDYVVLSAEERAKGFVRPVRRSYRHVGMPEPAQALRDLTDDERTRYQQYGYVKFQPYPDYPEKSSIAGRFWTQAELDKVGKGCGTVTTMSQAIAETYARDPGFYGATFCCGCGKHLPIGKVGEFVWDDAPDQRVGT